MMIQGTWTTLSGSRLIGATVLAACLAATSTAAAQNALGDGRALDANLSTTSRYNQPKQGFLLNRINEAIVTGTAPGGKNFRGTVGYSSPFEFRGVTGGRRVFDFERDSFYSGIGARRDVLRQPRSLGSYQVPRPSTATVGSPYGSGVNLITPMSGASLQQIARARYGSSMPDLDASSSVRQFRPQRTLAAPSTEVTSGSALERNLSPAARAAISTVDPLLDRNTLSAATASGALSRSRSALAGADATSGAITRNVMSRGIDRTFDGVSFAEGWSNRIAPVSAASPSAAAPLLAGQDSYADHIAQMASRNTRATLPQIGEPYSGDTMTTIRDFSRDWLGIDAESELVTAEPVASPPNSLTTLTDEKVAQLSQPLPAIASLAGDNSSQFADRVRTAETALSEGRYFDAESWFDVALYYTPDHPLAMAGRVHAQLGAGKYRSAALGLRRLFEAHPELINTRYAPKLLPQPDRTAAIIVELKEMFARAGATVEAGLLLAYVGHLTEQSELITQGLDELDLKQPDDVLSDILRRVWLPADQP